MTIELFVVVDLLHKRNLPLSLNLSLPILIYPIPTALQTVRKAMTHIYYGVENGWLRLSLWAARAGSPFSTPKSAVASFPHCL